jgi:hypothetical protein
MNSHALPGLPADSMDIRKQLLSRAGFADAVNDLYGVALE